MWSGVLLPGRLPSGRGLSLGGRGVRRRTRLVFLRKDPGDARYACPNDSRVAHAILPLCLDGDALIGNVGGGAIVRDCASRAFALRRMEASNRLM